MSEDFRNSALKSRLEILCAGSQPVFFPLKQLLVLIKFAKMVSLLSFSILRVSDSGGFSVQGP